MALGDSYATLAELKTRLNIGATVDGNGDPIQDTVDDSQLTNVLAAASRGIEKYCRRQFNDAGSATARVFYPLVTTIVKVDDFSTATGLVVKTDTSDSGTFDTTWADTDYQLLPLGGIQDGLAGWPYWRIKAVGTLRYSMGGLRPSVEVTARWGWAAVPAPIKEACLALAEETFKMKDSPYGVAGFGDYVVRIRQNPKIAAMLNDYRRNAVRVR